MLTNITRGKKSFSAGDVMLHHGIVNKGTSNPGGKMPSHKSHNADAIPMQNGRTILQEINDTRGIIMFWNPNQEKPSIRRSYPLLIITALLNLNKLGDETGQPSLGIQVA